MTAPRAPISRRDDAADDRPIGIVPQTRKRIVAFIRPWIRSGVIAWRRLTWLML